MWPRYASVLVVALHVVLWDALTSFSYTADFFRWAVLLGINLTSADTCIMHDLDFNPFNDLQAEGRKQASVAAPI